MAIGIPMQVVAAHGGSALCLYRGETILIDTKSVGEQAPGTWLLVFLNRAREVISSKRALQMEQILETSRVAMQGKNACDLSFDDLVNQRHDGPE